MVGLHGAKKPYTFNLICKCLSRRHLKEQYLFTKRVASVKRGH